MADTNPTHDPRYAHVVTKYAVVNYEADEPVEVVFDDEATAQRYVDGQWSDERYSIKPVSLVTHLPELRPLYRLYGRVHHDPANETTRELDPFSEDPGEYPGLGNGAIVSLDEIKLTIDENPYGWHVRVTGWDKDRVEAEFARLVAETEATRTRRVEAFSRFPYACVARTHDGVTLTRCRDHRRGGVLCWRTLEGAMVYDYDLDPATMTLLVDGSGR